MTATATEQPISPASAQWVVGVLKELRERFVAKQGFKQASALREAEEVIKDLVLFPGLLDDNSPQVDLAQKLQDVSIRLSVLERIALDDTLKRSEFRKEVSRLKTHHDTEMRQPWTDETH